MTMIYFLFVCFGKYSALQRKTVNKNAALRFIEEMRFHSENLIKYMKTHRHDTMYILLL